MLLSLVHFHLTSSGLEGILSSLEAAGHPFFLGPLEDTAMSKNVFYLLYVSSGNCRRVSSGKMIMTRFSGDSKERV